MKNYLKDLIIPFAGASMIVVGVAGFVTMDQSLESKGESDSAVVVSQEATPNPLMHKALSINTIEGLLPHVLVGNEVEEETEVENEVVTKEETSQKDKKKKKKDKEEKKKEDVVVATPESTPKPTPTPAPTPEPTQKPVQVAKTNRWGITLTSSEKALLANIVWLESRGESDSGQQAVVEVIFNRMYDDYFPDTLYGVLSQRNQFSTWSNRNSAKPDQRVYDNINKVLNGQTNILPFQTIYFSTMGHNNRVQARIGGHIFCNK